jgi:hypothetical protein
MQELRFLPIQEHRLCLLMPMAGILPHWQQAHLEVPGEQGHLLEQQDVAAAQILAARAAVFSLRVLELYIQVVLEQAPLFKPTEEQQVPPDSAAVKLPQRPWVEEQEVLAAQELLEAVVARSALARQVLSHQQLIFPQQAAMVHSVATAVQEQRPRKAGAPLVEPEATAAPEEQAGP